MVHPLIAFVFDQLDAVVGCGRCSERPKMASSTSSPLVRRQRPPPGALEQEGRGPGSPTEEPGRGSPSPTPALRQAQRLGRIAGRSIGRRPGVVVGCQGCLGAARLAAGEEVVYGRLLGECILRWPLGIFVMKLYFYLSCNHLHVQRCSLVRSPCI